KRLRDETLKALRGNGVRCDTRRAHVVPVHGDSRADARQWVSDAGRAGRVRLSGGRRGGARGAYALAADIAVVDTTCIEITASNVTLDLAGHTLSCTGSGFAGSCQGPEFTSRGVTIAPQLTGITLKGPGTIPGFDNGVVITGSNAHVKGLTIAGPPC